MLTDARFLVLGVCGAAGLAIAIAIAYPGDPPPGAATANPSPPKSFVEFKPLPPLPPLQHQTHLPPLTPVAISPPEETFAVMTRATQLPPAEQAAPAPAPVADPPAVDPPAPAPAAEVPAPTPEALPAPPRVRRDEGDDRLYINVSNTDIREVLQLLSAQGGLNILAGKNVTGTVSASLSGVDVETALNAILKSTGYTARREGQIIFVGTPADLEAMDQTVDRVLTRMYRPNYVKAADLQSLILPMLTPEIGKVTVSAPAQVDIPPDKVKAGGMDFGGNDAVIVRDYEAVLRVVDQIVKEVDRRPAQVAIEATIMSVKLSDQFKFGVSFDLLKNSKARLILGTPPANLNNLDLAAGGLKFGYLDTNLGMLIEALETVGETNVIASPRLMVLNKQRAEIQIGEELGYVNTTVTENSATQSVAFLEVGTLLRLRPFVDSDNVIRMEVHPELSTGTVNVQQGLTLPNKSVTQVTTNIMCRDGRSVVIGGLIREDLKKDARQVPYLGSLPYLGVLFRQKTENVDRVEIIVVITPRIVGDCGINEESESLANQFVSRQDIFFDKLSPIGKRNVGNRHLRLARAAVAAGDWPSALKQINWAIHYDPESREAVTLREEIIAAGGYENESVNMHLKQGLATRPNTIQDRSKEGYPWKRHDGFGEQAMHEPRDEGIVTPKRSIERHPVPTQPLPPQGKPLPQPIAPAKPTPAGPQN